MTELHSGTKSKRLQSFSLSNYSKFPGAGLHQQAAIWDPNKSSRILTQDLHHTVPESCCHGLNHKERNRAALGWARWTGRGLLGHSWRSDVAVWLGLYAFLPVYLYVHPISTREHWHFVSPVCSSSSCSERLLSRPERSSASVWGTFHSCHHPRTRRNLWCHIFLFRLPSFFP